MTDKNCEIFQAIYRMICLFITLVMVIYWIHQYHLDEDLCLVDYKKYYSTPSDVFPVLSICFKPKYLISEEKLVKQNPRINKSTYLSFLEGNKFDLELMKVSYENVVMDVNEFVVSEYICFRYKGCHAYDIANKSQNIFSRGFSIIDYSSVSFGCFTLERQSNKQITSYSVLIKTSIWPNNSRPQAGGMFALLHHPNQLMLSASTFRMSWPKRERYDSLEMVFDVQGVEVLRRRNKVDSPCEEDWKYYDYKMLEEQLSEVGCQAPYQIPREEFMLCNASHQMNKLRISLKESKFKHRPPCRAMEKIYYKYRDSILEKTSWARKDHFWLGTEIRDSQFKESLQTR